MFLRKGFAIRKAHTYNSNYCGFIDKDKLSIYIIITITMYYSRIIKCEQVFVGILTFTSFIEMKSNLKDVIKILFRSKFSIVCF